MQADLTGKYKDRDSFKSDEEYWIYGWLLELTIRGYIKSFYYEPTSFELSKISRIKWNKQLKTKSKEQEIRLKDSINYTPDFLVFWNLDKTDGLLTYDSNGLYVNRPLFFLQEYCNYSFIEVKGSYDRNGGNRDTMTKIGWVYSKLGYYITVLKPLKLFPKTFYPELYLLTNTKRSDRKKKIKGTLVPYRDFVKTIEEYDCDN